MTSDAVIRTLTAHRALEDSIKEAMERLNRLEKEISEGRKKLDQLTGEEQWLMSRRKYILAMNHVWTEKRRSTHGS